MLNFQIINVKHTKDSIRTKEDALYTNTVRQGNLAQLIK